MPPVVSAAAATFGTNVRALRTARGWSQERLADEASLHWTFVGQVERGQRNITLSNMVKLAAGLGVSLAELVKGL